MIVVGDKVSGLPGAFATSDIFPPLIEAYSQGTVTDINGSYVTVDWSNKGHTGQSSTHHVSELYKVA